MENLHLKNLKQKLGIYSDKTEKNKIVKIYRYTW